MKQLIAMLCLYSIANTVLAQTKINKTISAIAITKADLSFEYADVTIKTWDKPEIQITGTISINKGKNDDAFDMKIKERNGKVSIETTVDAISFQKNVLSKNKSKSFSKKENKGGYNDCVTYSNHIKNTLVIMVPAMLELKSSSVYGSTIIEGFTKSIKIDNTYGSIDAFASSFSNENIIEFRSIYAPVDLTIPATSQVDMELTTGFGKIYSDLDMQININRSMSKKLFGDKVKSTLNGGGNKIKLESNYSNIYVRES